MPAPATLAPPRDPDQLRRLLAKIEIGPEHWLWQGATVGHDQTLTPVIHHSEIGNQVSAPRLLFALYTQEPIGPEERVTRSCGEERCLNPAHLRAVSRAGTRVWRKGWRPGQQKPKRRRKRHQPQRTPVLREFAAIQRLYAQVAQREDGCWLQHLGKSGRQLGYQGKKYALSRLLFALAQGKPLESDELLLNHCGTPGCLNPAHHTIGDLSGVWHNHAFSPTPWTHCSKGHELTPENVYLTKTRHNKDGSPRRECRQCKRERRRAKRALTSRSNGR